MKIQTPNILSKNIKTYWNSKASSIIFILGPILLILIIGFALQDTSLKNIKAGIYYEEETSFTSNFIQKLTERSFIVNQESDLDECRRKVVEGINHVCIKLEKQGSQENNYNIELHVDFSKQRIVWGIIGSIQGVVEEESYNTRQGSIGELKTSSQDLIETLRQEEMKVNYAIQKLEDTERELNQIRTRNQEIRNSINDIDEQLTNIEANLELISTMYENIPGLEENLLSINQIRQNLSTINQSLNLNEIVDLQGDLRSTKADLQETKNSLAKTREGLEGIKETDMNRFADPILLSYNSVIDNQEGEIKKKLKDIDYLFPTLLIFYILFGSILIAAITRIKERKSNAYVRNISSKTKGIEFILSDFLTTLILIIIQAALIFLVAYFFLNLNFFPNIASLAILTLIIISTFILIGLAVGSIFSSQESTIIASVAISILFFIFSSTIIPMEILPEIISKIVSLLPLTLLETKLRLILIFNTPLSISPKDILSLLGTAALSSLVLAFFYHKNKEKEI